MANLFFVTQGQAYNIESIPHNGYIWAPRYSQRADNPEVPYPPKFYWENLTLVKKGDIIIHHAGSLNGGIADISIAETDCYTANIPPELKNISNANIPGVGTWIDEGWRVDCDYVHLKNRMPIEKFKSVILKYRRNYPGARSAFNKNGGVCQGYLYELEEMIGYHIIKSAVQLNPNIINLEFIVSTLKNIGRNEIL